MVDTAASIFRDFVTDGVPASGANKPQKSKIREWGAYLEGAAGIGPVATVASLRGLDTALVTAALVTQPDYDVLFKWDGSDLSARTVVSSMTSTAVNSGTGTITKATHGLLTGMGVVSTTAVNGLALNTLYWVIKIDANNFKLASSLANAIAGTAITLTGTTNFTVKQLYDPSQNTYVVKTGGQIDGTAGAWVKLGAAPTGQFFSSSGARVERFNDRAFFGDATKHDGADSIPQSDWLTAFELAKGRAGGSLMYSVVGISNKETDTRNSNTLMVGSSTDGLLDFYNGIAIRSLAKNNSVNSHVSAYAGYFEGYRDVSAVAGAYALELDTINFASTVNIDPFQQQAGQSIGLQLAAGGEYSSVGQFPVSSAINIQYNNAAYRKGIVFGSDSIDGTNGTDGGIGQAITLATGHAIDYYYAANAVSWRVTAGIGIHGNYIISTFGDGSVVLPKVTATTVNNVGLAVSGGVTAAGITVASGKSIVLNNTIAFSGVDSSTVTFQGSDTYVGRTTTDTLTNKSINATNNTVSNLTTSMFATSVVDTDGTLAANSDTRIASQKAVKTYAVTGPASSVSGNVSTFSGVGGRTLADSGVAFSIDGTLASNSDAKAPTEKAVKTYVDGAAYTAYTPTITAGTGTLTTTSATGRSRTIGKTVFVEMIITITTNGTGAGTIVATLPTAAIAGFHYIIAGRENAIAGKMLQGYIAGSATTVVITNYDNTYPASNGAVLILSGSYERA